MDSITSNLAAIVLVIAGLCLVSMLVLQALQISRLRQRLDMLTRGADGESLEAVLGAHLETVHQVGRDLDELTARTAVMESAARHHFARLGLVRFNPFPDTGGNQSFALALMDESEEGFVVSSLHSRTGTRIYAKAIVGGKADTSLSSEETEALDLARARKTVRPTQGASRGTGGRPAGQPSGSASAGVRSAGGVPKAAPAAVPKAAPAAVPKAAPARTTAPATAPTPAAAAAPATPPPPIPESDRKLAGGSQTTDRSSAIKGQSKGAEVAGADAVSATDSERTGRKPGRAMTVDPTSVTKTRAPGS